MRTARPQSGNPCRPSPWHSCNRHTRPAVNAHAMQANAVQAQTAHAHAMHAHTLQPMQTQVHAKNHLAVGLQRQDLIIREGKRGMFSSYKDTQNNGCEEGAHTKRLLTKCLLDKTSRYKTSPRQNVSLQNISSTKCLRMKTSLRRINKHYLV